MKFIANYIMQGRTQATIAASTLALLSLKFPPASIVSLGVIALITLRLGAGTGLYIQIGAGLAAATLGFFALGNYQFALFYALLLWLPVWLIAILLRLSRQLSLAVEATVFIGMLGVVGFYLFVDQPAALWSGFLQQVLPKTQAPIEDVQAWIEKFSHYMTGMFAAGAIFCLLCGLFLGRWWQALLFNPGGFKQEFLQMKTSPKLSIVSIAIFMAALLTDGTASEIAWNICIPLFVLYTVMGTSVLHVVFAQTKMSRYAVPMFYFTLFVLPQVLPPVAIIGLIDAWLNLRNRHSNQTGAK